jgi:hypothetical protein
MGPNAKRLMIHKMSLDAVPTGGGMKSALDFLMTPGAMATSAKAATEWVSAAILAVRQATEPNPWKNSDDEKIAGELLRLIEERKKQQRESWLRHSK